MNAACHRLLLVATVWATGACGEDNPAGWQPTELDGADRYFSSVWGASPDDIFVVGGVRSGTVHHFDGGEWRAMELPPRIPPLIWVFGFASDDVYAVGERGVFLRYNGVEWTSLDSNTAKTLWGAWGTGPDDLWLVGGFIDDGRPTIRRWNGSESEVFEVDPAEYSDDVHALFKVWGDGTTVYTVGQAGTILRYADGGRWTAVPTGETSQDFIAIWGTGPDDVIAVGGRGSGRIARYDGDTFQTSIPDGVGGVSAVFACPDRVLVGGDPSFVGTFDRTTGAVEVELVSFNPVHAIWSDCADTAVAVGGLFAEPPTLGVVVREE